MRKPENPNDAPTISDAESTVMDVLWTRSPLTAEQVVAALADRQDWREATIKTLLNRLLKKGAVKAEAEGRRYRYSPAVAREDYVSAQSESLIERLFGGRIAPLVAHFSEQQKLSKADIAELRTLLQELDDQASNDRERNHERH